MKNVFQGVKRREVSHWGPSLPPKVWDLREAWGKRPLLTGGSAHRAVGPEGNAQGACVHTAAPFMSSGLSLASWDWETQSAFPLVPSQFVLLALFLSKQAPYVFSGNCFQESPRAHALARERGGGCRVQQQYSAECQPLRSSLRAHLTRGLACPEARTQYFTETSWGHRKWPGLRVGFVGQRVSLCTSFPEASHYLGQTVSHKHLCIDPVLCPHGGGSTNWLLKRFSVCYSFASLLFTSPWCQSMQLTCSAFEIIWFLNVESTIPPPAFNTCLLWKPACWASNLCFFFLTFLLFPAPCSLLSHTDRGRAIDTSWQAAAWRIFFIHPDISSAKKKQGLGTCSIHFGFHRSYLFQSCLTNSLVGCYCLIPVSLEVLPVVLKGWLFSVPLRIHLPHIGACVRVCSCAIS